MRVLILGAGGMLGHKLWQEFRDRFDTWVTARARYQDYARYGLFDHERFLSRVDATDMDSAVGALAEVNPDVVINCIGIVKQLPSAKDPVPSIKLNALFPHQLAGLCRAGHARLIHISTDCVFSGRQGMYTEDDISDAEDLYGRTKFLGEVDRLGALTLRTSIIGRELSTQHGLIEWFLSNNGGKIKGFTKAIYSGFPTLHMARIIANIIEHHPELYGVYQVSSEPINKYDLLCRAREAYNISVEIAPDDTVEIDRSLDSSRFRKATGFSPAPWPKMIEEMAADSTRYDDWK